MHRETCRIVTAPHGHAAPVAPPGRPGRACRAARPGPAPEAKHVPSPSDGRRWQQPRARVDPHFHINPAQARGASKRASSFVSHCLAPHVAASRSGSAPLARFRDRKKALVRAITPAHSTLGTFYMTLMFLWVFYRARKMAPSC